MTNDVPTARSRSASWDIAFHDAVFAAVRHRRLAEGLPGDAWRSRRLVGEA